MHRLTIERTMVILLALMLFGMALRIPADTDSWWHIRSGDYTMSEGMIHGDPFSHTKTGAEWINHSWGSQIVLKLAWQYGNDTGLALYTAVLATAGMMALYPICVGNAYLRSFVLIAGGAAAAVFWSARPQMLSFLFSSIVLLLIYSYKQGKGDRLWLLVPLMWVWSNLHAGWSIGYLLILAFLAGEGANALLGTGDERMGWKGWRKLLLVTLVSIPFLALSPYGLDNALVPFNTVSIGSLRDYIQEWNSPNFQGRETWPFIGLVMALFGALWGSRRAFDWSGFFLLIGTLFLALLYGRNVALFAVVAAPLLTHHLDDILTRRGLILHSRMRVPLRLARLNAVTIVIVALVVLVYSAWVLQPERVDQAQQERLPIAAAEYLATHDLPREMFNSYNWGGYLMFAAPEYLVFIDGRTDLYGEFLQTYLDTALAKRDWRDTLVDYNINLVMVEEGSGLDLALREEPDWTLVYEDDLAVIHVRDNADAQQ